MDMSGFCFRKQAVEIEGMRKHVQCSIRSARPRIARPIPVKLDAVFVGIAQVKRFAHAVIRGAIEGNAGPLHAHQRIGQFRPRGIKNRGVKKPRASRWRRRTAQAFPRIQAEVMMIPASRNKRRASTEALRQLEAKDATIKCQRALQVGDLEMHMADPHVRMN